MQLTASIHMTDQGRVFLFDQFFETALADRLLTFFKTSNDWQVREEYSHWPGRLVYGGQDQVLEEIKRYAQRPDVLKTLSQLSEYELTLYGVDLWKDQQGYKIDPHQDFMGTDRFCHVQIYMSDHIDHGMGTAFYSDSNLKSAAFQIPYKNNSGYFMVTGQQVWHGLPTINRQVNRYSLQIRYSIK